MKELKYRTWIEISTSAIAKNIKTFKSLLSKGTQLLGVVKSNAYGHELMGFAKELEKRGIDRLGVDSIVEARTLRAHGITKPILVLGYTLPTYYSLANGNNIAITLSNPESLNALLKLKKKIHVHIKTDTGMHRQGFSIEAIPSVLKKLSKSPHIKVEGLYTHFAAAKRPDENRDTEKQIEKFKVAINLVKKQYPQAIAHAAATAGTLNYPEAHFDMVRVGIGLYGLWPSKETKEAFRLLKIKDKGFRISLHPVLTWKAIISEINTVEKGEKIGYDYTEALQRNSRLAIIPIGYWHGYWRALSSKAHVLVKGQCCKIVGRVAMDMIVADVTDVLSAKVMDEAVLIGSQGPQTISADELADIAGTSNYEIVTRLNPLIKKVYK